MAIDTNITTTTSAMDYHTNLAQENKHLQEKNRILYEQVNLLTKLHNLRQERLLHQHQAQNVDSEDLAMKEDQDQSLSAPTFEPKHEAEKQLEEELKQDDSDVTLGRDVGGDGCECECECEQEPEHGGEPAQDKNAEENKENDDKMDEDEDEDKKEEYSEEEHSSYANSEASDYEGPEPWTGDDLGGDPEDSNPEDEDSDDDMEDEDKDHDKWGPWSTGTSQARGPESYQNRQSRSYFIAKYKRDKLCNATAEDRKLAENPPPSSLPYATGGLGECKLDSWLYFDHGFEPTRKDFNAYKSLYGLHPAILDFIEYEPTIRLLDRHAEIISSCDCPPKQEFHDKFREFIEAFEKADYPPDYLEGDLSSEVARAHMAFCELLGRPL